MFLIYKCCEQPNFVHLENLSVCVSQSISEILSTHTFSQIIHLLELLNLQQCIKLIILLLPSQRMFPALGEAPVYLKLPFVDCI